MPIQGRYVGRTEFDYQGMNIIHNHIYLIDIVPQYHNFPWAVKIYDNSPWGKIIRKITGQYKEKAWIPYNEYPSKYWVINANINYDLIGAANPQLKIARPLFPSFCPRG